MKMSLKMALISSFSVVLISSAVVSPARADEKAQGAEEKKDAKPPMDFRKLRDSLPAKIRDMAQTDKSGSRTKLGEMDYVMVESKYETEKDNADKPNGTITLSGFANPEMAKAMSMGILNAEIDQESDEEFTRTTTVQGVKGVLAYNKVSKSLTFTTLLQDRVVFNANFVLVEEADIPKWLEALPIKAVEEVAKTL
jgi:hypothetical protein